jgi:hypothetical protein
VTRATLDGCDYRRVQGRNRGAYLQIRFHPYSQFGVRPDTRVMKLLNHKLLGKAVLALTLLTSSVGFAQTSVTETTTTNTAGTISEFSPDTIIVRTESAPEPVRYSYTKTTTYVDESGAPVSVETVKSGLPVTVYYTKVGDRMVASKVVVRKVVAVPVVPATGATVTEKKTTTTTTETK